MGVRGRGVRGVYAECVRGHGLTCRVEAVVLVRVGHVDELLGLRARASQALADVDRDRWRAVRDQGEHDTLLLRYYEESGAVDLRRVGVRVRLGLGLGLGFGVSGQWEREVSRGSVGGSGLGLGLSSGSPP